VLEATATGPLHKSGSQEGMVVDFGILKEVMLREVAGPWDHAFLCWLQDQEMRNALTNFEGHKTVFMTEVPTVENLCAKAFRLLYEPLADEGLVLEHVRLYETPNCWADCRYLTKGLKGEKQ
jgi:6-pyruvoyltetrahydropterin/6-carboxytetrahydropterin synthase